MATAKITNIVKDADKVVVFVDYSGSAEQYYFQATATRDEILAKVVERLIDYNTAEQSVSDLQALINVEVE